MIRKLTWEEFMKLIYYTGGVAQYLHQYLLSGHRGCMNSELAHQVQEVV